MRFDENDNDDQIKDHYCQCKSGTRMVGCCGHIAIILWYLGYVRHFGWTPPTRIDQFRKSITGCWQVFSFDKITSIIFVNSVIFLHSKEKAKLYLTSKIVISITRTKSCKTDCWSPIMDQNIGPTEVNIEKLIWNE